MWILFLFPLMALATGPEPRVFQFSYAFEDADFPPGEAVDIYIPTPAQHDGQRVLEQSFQASVPGEVGQEVVYGNVYYHLHRPADSSVPLSASLHWTVAREAAIDGRGAELSPSQRVQYLSPNTLVPVGHEMLQPILAEIHMTRADDSPAATARAIYDWVVDNVEYKKVGTGWGNGDTFWACNERYGNCTDFHALFIALARSEGIPARFEIGFSIPQDRLAGEIRGYHCWVQFYLDERGWVPIDASEASKHPEKRELFFGGQLADRVHFTTGRDLIFSAGSAETPLNYFIYPYVEVGGKPWRGKLQTQFSFEEVASLEAAG